MSGHTEAQIRRAIKVLLASYGELTTTEVKEKLHIVLEFNDEDKRVSKTRPKEILIYQRIGNIISHQKEKVRTYEEGFVVDKSIEPAKFLLRNPFNKEISLKEISTLKEKRERFLARKIDWEKRRERNNEIGDQGEEFAMEYEIDRLVESLSMEREKATQSVSHLSRLQGDGLGYDIASINDNGQTRYIEVKTTTGECNQPFYMSKNEKYFFEVYGNAAFIYRVYNFNKETREGKVKIISNSELIKNFIFDPITWEVKPKEGDHS